MRLALLGTAIATLTVLCVAASLAARALDAMDYATALLMAASAGFAMLGLLGWAAVRSSYAALVAVGLGFCALGDLAGIRSFQTSVAAFLLAHLVFIAALAVRGLSTPRLVLALLIMLAPSGVISWWLFPHVPEPDFALVLGYVCVITTMVVFAGGTRDGAGRNVLLPGAILFYFSDIFVARSQFVSPGPINAFLCYPLYYAACLLLASSSWAGHFDRRSGTIAESDAR